MVIAGLPLNGKGQTGVAKSKFLTAQPSRMLKVGMPEGLVSVITIHKPGTVCVCIPYYLPSETLRLKGQDSNCTSKDRKWHVINEHRLLRK